MDYTANTVPVVQQQSIIIDLKLISQTFLTISDSNIRLLFVHKDIHLLGFHIERIWNLIQQHFI